MLAADTAVNNNNLKTAKYVFHKIDEYKKEKSEKGEEEESEDYEESEEDEVDADWEIGIDYLLTMAAKYGRLEIVEFLIERC